MMTTAEPTVLLLAAGRGERFRAAGGGMPKLDALLAGRPVREHTLAAIRASGLPLHVVWPDPSRPGMGDSIAAGVRATRDSPGWLVLPADLPLVRPETLRAVAVALAGHSVVVPVHQGRLGHPVGFGPACGEALERLRGDRGAQAVRAAWPAFELAVDDPGVVMDIDTPQDLAAAERWLALRQGHGCCR